MNVKPILQRLATLEQQASRAHQTTIPTYDTSNLSGEQHERVREAARLMLAIRDGVIKWTEQRRAIIQEVSRILTSCPPLRSEVR